MSGFPHPTDDPLDPACECRHGHCSHASTGCSECSCDQRPVVCCWCGVPSFAAMTPLAAWCPGCQEKHRAAFPDAYHWRGWSPIENCLPGGRYDGILEESGLTTEPER